MIVYIAYVCLELSSFSKRTYLMRLVQHSSYSLHLYVIVGSQTRRNYMVIDLPTLRRVEELITDIRHTSVMATVAGE